MTEKFECGTCSNMIPLGKECPNCIEKFECGDCGCYFWTKDRSNFDCPNCEDKRDEDWYLYGLSEMGLGK